MQITRVDSHLPEVRSIVGEVITNHDKRPTNIRDINYKTKNNSLNMAVTVYNDHSNLGTPRKPNHLDIYI